MRLRKITTADKSELEFVQRLYIESFPPDERRSVLEMQRLMDEDSTFEVYLIEEENIKSGFLTYWNFDTFIFAEHFAINAELRNGGYGKKTLEAFFEQTSLPILIEVELPDNELAARRISFYERMGFKKWDIPYQQPPYEEKFQPVPMLLMTYREIDLKSRFESIKSILHSRVYKIHQ